MNTVREAAVRVMSPATEDAAFEVRPTLNEVAT